MRDLELQASGALAIFVAIIHGAISELRVFPKVRIEFAQGADTAADSLARRRPRLDRTGVLLIATPALGSETARRWIMAVAVVAYSYGAVGNVVVSRGRHIGGYLMGVAIALALMGL